MNLPGEGATPGLRVRPRRAAATGVHYAESGSPSSSRQSDYAMDSELCQHAKAGLPKLGVGDTRTLAQGGPTAMSIHNS